MNNVKYSIVENSNSFTFGIAACDTSSPQNVIAYINDITCDRLSLERLVDLCNRENLSLIHLNDVIDDFLCR